MRRQSLAILILPALFVAMTTLACSKRVSAPILLPVGSVSDSSLEFGSVAVGDCAEAKFFRVTNSGGGTLVGEVSSPSADFVLASGGGRYSLGAGEGVEVVVQFCPQSEGARGCTLSTGFGVGVVCTGAAGPGPVCVVSPTSLDFGTVTIGYAVERQFTITNAGGGTLVDTVSGGGGSWSSPNLSAGVRGYALTAGQSTTFSVRFAPTEAGGPQTCMFSTGHSPVLCSGLGRDALAPEFLTSWDCFQPFSMAAVGNDTLLVVEYGNHVVDAFSSSGLPLYSWRVVNAGAICVERTGTVLVSDASNVIHRFSVTGSQLAQWTSHSAVPGVYLGISGIATSANGDIYVCEAASKRVQVYTKDGSFIRSWGTQGSADGQFRSPLDIAMSPDGRVFVLDVYNGIQVFAADGRFLSRWGAQGGAPGELDGPRSLAFTPDQRVLVVDAYQSRVSVFDLDGGFVRDFGGYGVGPGQFTGVPEAIVVTPEFGIYVSERSGRISKFRGIYSPSSLPAPK